MLQKPMYALYDQECFKGQFKIYMLNYLVIVQHTEFAIWK